MLRNQNKQVNVNPQSDKNLHLKSGLNRKHSRFNEDLARSKSVIKLNTSKKDSITN